MSVQQHLCLVLTTTVAALREYHILFPISVDCCPFPLASAPRQTPSCLSGPCPSLIISFKFTLQLIFICPSALHYFFFFISSSCDDFDCFVVFVLYAYIEMLCVSTRRVALSYHNISAFTVCMRVCMCVSYSLFNNQNIFAFICTHVCVYVCVCSFGEKVKIVVVNCQ